MLQTKTFGELKEIGQQLNVSPAGDWRLRQTWIDAIAGVNPPLLQLLEVSPAVSVEQVQTPIIETVETSSGVEFDRVQEPISQVAKTSPGVEFDRVQEPISQVAKTSPGVELGPTQEPISQVTKTSPGVEFDRVQEPIEPAAKHHLDQESDQNPILTGIPLSDRFVARYSPPQSENIRFQLDAGGQLSLLDFEVQSEPEPPDPDDFQSLDAFREAITRWESEHSEPLEVSLDSFCEWVPCPAQWYEPSKVMEPAKVMELSPITKSSITLNFFIPTFDAWCDRLDKNDEPPDTGISPACPSQTQDNGHPELSRNYFIASSAAPRKRDRRLGDFKDLLEWLFQSFNLKSNKPNSDWR